jgi:hypothetical protein
MHHLFKFVNLKSFTLKCECADRYIDTLGCTEKDVFEHLTTWLQEEHQKRHAKFDRQIVYPRGGDKWQRECFWGWGSVAGNEWR